MDKNQINDIEVKGFLDVTLQSIKDIDDAKKLLRSSGYFVDNLWMTEDVLMNYKCSQEKAQEVLYGALTNDATYQQVWEAITYEAESMNLTRRE